MLSKCEPGRDFEPSNPAHILFKIYGYFLDVEQMMVIVLGK